MSCPSDALAGESAPRVSVVVCTRHRERLLAGLLETLSRQTAPAAAWEVLVVDNGPSDATRRTVEAAAIPTASHYLDEAEVGLSAARNRGFRQARGDWVGYTDDDCRLPPHWLETALEVIERHAPDVFGGPFRPFYDSPKPAWFRDAYGSFGRGDEARWLEPGERLSGGNVFFRRSVLEELGGFDTRLGMAGGRVAYGEESDLQERLRSRYPLARFHYHPDLCVEHLVRREKMRLGWILTAAFGKGYSAYLAALAPEPPGSRAALPWRLFRTACGVIADASIGGLRRDRSRYPRHANYLWEHTSAYFRRMGTLWAALREPESRARGRAASSSKESTPCSE